MALDFTTGVLDPRVTITRASNTATCVNASGLVEVVNANLPRFDYNPATLAPKGLLIEEARTNIFLESAGFDTVLWNKGNATVTANAATAPDGTLSADKIVENTANNFHRISQVPVLTAVSHTVTIYAKPAGRDWLYMGNASASQAAYFNVSTGVIGTIVGVATATITPAGNGWYRCSITSTPSLGAQNYSFYTANANGSFIYTGDGVSGLYIWGAQLEIGAFATSYIPTAASQVTRNPDVAEMTGTNFSSWYNQTEGTFVAYTSATAASARSLTASAGAVTNQLFVQGGAATSIAFNVFISSAFVAQLGSLPASALKKVAGAYKVNDFAASVNGGTVDTDTLGALATFDRVNLGANALGTGGFLNGHILKIAYYNLRLTNAELRAFST
jgi:hypothetical protein